jgi:uncharacterized protein (TIGR00369 family)
MKIDFESLKQVPNDPDSTCFACGKKNPMGFQLVFYTDEKEIYSKHFIRPEFSGWSHLAHGGILATLLDETMAWTGIYLLKKYILTKSMSISYLKPVSAGSEIVLRGFIEQEISKREIAVVAEIYNALGELCATGKGNLVLFSQESFHRLKLTSPEFLETFERHVFLD